MEKEKKQVVKRVYPVGYTGDTFNELNQLLKEGWIVKQVIMCNQKPNGDIINDWLLEKDKYNE